jgi:prepilin-type N-terminal cleavage/methylation domain-containing protein/prepilin-type processing-associated H-X9-DG protein
MNRYSCRRCGFTLIEILVVIGIIALLSALLLSVFSRVREKGRATQCQSNLHQLGLAFQQYTADNGRFPSWYNAYMPSNPLPSKHPGLSWGRRVEPYVKDVRLFQCPSANSSTDPEPMWAGNGDGYSDYNYNLGLSGKADSRVTKASEVIMLFDGGSGPAYLSSLNDTTDVAPSGGGDRHSGGFHAVFVDGHTKWVTRQSADAYTEVQ